MYKELVTNVNTARSSILKSKGIRVVQLPIREYKLVLENVIYVLDLKLNILLIERLKCNNCVKYSN